MQDKETRDREDKIESDGEIVAEKPAFLRWLGNFWFYHKWAVIAAVFVIVLLSVTVRQSCANARTDITVMYAGSCYMADSGFEACREAIADYLPADAGSDGRYEAGIAALHIYSEEQIRDREERARTDTSVIKVNNYVNTSELQSFDNLIVAGEYSVIIAEPWLYKRVAASGIVRKLDEVLGFTPVDAGKAVTWWEQKAGFSLAAQQTNALEQCLCNKFSIITGGPGVGKTTIIRALVDIYGAKKLKVVLAAPTGRAAKRMSESVGAAAQTIHRLLKWNPVTNKFTFNKESPLEGDVFIFDETSMIDIKLANDLLSAIPSTAAVVLVGDTDQLPSVGAGNVLGDLIKSGSIAFTRLDQIFRQDAGGLIVTNAHHVNAGEPLEIRSGDTDFYFVRCEDPEQCLRRAIEFMTTRIPRKFGLDPLEDVQVLTPMRRNLLGTESLNFELQKALNPSGAALIRGGTTFRVGDRVMQLRNNYDKDVYNGDVGFIKAVDPTDRSLVVTFDGRPVKYDAGDLDELVLAYATTIHKSQGSEYPAVIVLIHTQHYVMLQRNLLYTAITRGKKLVLLIGVPYAVNRAIDTNVVRERRT
ncbi:MAG: AAA family ATPase, partial [Clostridia bacterium]|nr:AAA family ATPase [Clostridia bacterium]